MSTHYIGRQSFYYGKTLFEIARNLKNYGVGRMVIRHNFQRYEEPTYFILTKVVPDMTDEKFEKGEAYAIRVFRGENLGNRKIDSGYRCDWQLVPKEEEAAILQKAETCKPREKTSVEPIGKIPPLMDLLLRNEMKAAGQDASKPLIYRKKISQSFTNTAVLENVENH